LGLQRLLQRRYEAEGRVSDALLQRMTIKLAGGDNVKQQGWLSKIVPQPKEATTHVCSPDPGQLVVAEHKPF
jgi:hypothetical protein